MKIAINGRFLTQRTTGVQRYAQEVVRALDQLVSEDHPATDGLDFEIVTPSKPLEPFSLTSITLRQAGKLNGHAWEQAELPWLTRDSLLLSLCNTGPAIKRNQMVVIHDAAVFAMPEAFSRSFRAWYRFLLPLLGRQLKHIVTVSNFSKSELSRYCNIPLYRITAIHEGFQHIKRLVPDNRILDTHGLSDRAFVLAVSSLNPSKNFQVLIQALDYLNHPDYDVVIAGGANSAVFSTSLEEPPANIRYLGYVTDAELIALYQHAQCFVHPTLYEGFGLTPLEAMACGCALVISDIPPLREVCGDAAIYVNPSNPAEIGSGIDQVMTDANLRKELASRGADQLRKFSWISCALGLLHVITGERR